MAKATKIHSDSYGSFNETILHKVLMCSNVHGNNNKFYSLEIQKSPNGNFCLFSHYGRLNGSEIKGGIFEIREGYYSESSAEREFNSILNKKKRGKTKKGKDGVSYREEYKEVDVVSSTVGSRNVKGAIKQGSVKQSFANDIFKDFGSVEQKILKMLEEENVHDITTSTNIKVTANGLQSPLGPLTLTHLAKAKEVLDRINKKIPKNPTKTISLDLKSLNNDYLSLIPRSFGAHLSDSDLITTINKVQKEYDLINQMETAIAIQDIKDDKDTDFSLGFTLKLADSDITASITKQIEKTRKHTHLNRYKVKRVFEVENFKERERFEKFADALQSKKKAGRQANKLDYQEVDLFHGSRNSNILSILMNGFYVPPSSAAHVTGRMFGNGVYGADVSTKALNYSAGGWGGKPNKYNNLFCFVTRFALGKVYETQRSRESGTPSGYDSIFAKGGADLQNNEYIVPNVSQTTISYLVEFE